jgi:hypothetical protein
LPLAKKLAYPVVSAQQLVDVVDVAEMPSVLAELPLTSIRLTPLPMAETPLVEMAELAETLPPQMDDLVSQDRETCTKS